MAQPTLSRMERAVIAVVAWLVVIPPLAWLAMLVTGAWANDRNPYWMWLLLASVGWLVGEGGRWLVRRWRSRRQGSRHG